MSLPTLYELAGQYRELQMLADSDDLPAEVIADTLEGVTGDLTTKSRNVAFVVQNLEAAADAVDEAAAAMKARAARMRRRAESVRAYLLFAMRSAGVSRIECPEFTLSIRQNPPSVTIADDAEIPAEYMVQPEPPPPRPDRKAIAAALKAGEKIDGCYLERGERLEIRT